MRSRRTLLGLLGSGLVASLAGCSGGIDDPTVEGGYVADETDDGRSTPQVDQDQVTASGYPTVTLNSAYYREQVIPEEAGEQLSVATTETAPQRTRDLNVVSICYSHTQPRAYFEEYQTAHAARQRLDVSEGDTLDLATTDEPATVTAVETVDGYPNDWYLLETEFDLHALSRAGGIIAGGYVQRDEYMDPAETVRDQIRTRSAAEGGGIPVFAFDVLDVVAGQYGHEQLALEANDAASVPLEEFSADRAKALAREYYDESLYEDFTLQEETHDSFPVDSHEVYEVSSDTTTTDFSVEVTSWASVEHATEYARQAIRGCDWTFDAHFPSTDLEESNLGPYDEDLGGMGIEPPLCGLATEDGVQKCYKETLVYDHSTPMTYDVFSGTTTMVRI